MDVTGSVITADAMRCRRETAGHIIGCGAHYVLTVKNNQPTLRAACKTLPWTDVPGGHRQPAAAARSRRTSPGLDRLPRRRSDHPTPPNPNHQKNKTIEVIYAICSMDMTAAPPATVATWIQRHWGIGIFPSKIFYTT